MKARLCPHGNRDSGKDSVRKDSATAQFDVIRSMPSIATLLSFDIGLILCRNQGRVFTKRSNQEICIRPSSDRSRRTKMGTMETGEAPIYYYRSGKTVGNCHGGVAS